MQSIGSIKGVQRLLPPENSESVADKKNAIQN